MHSPGTLPKLRDELRQQLLSNPYEQNRSRIEVGRLSKLMGEFDFEIPVQQNAGWSFQLLNDALKKHTFLSLGPEERRALQELVRMLLLREVIEQLHKAKAPETTVKTPESLHSQPEIIKRLASLFLEYKAQNLPTPLLHSVLDMGFRYWRVAACLLGIVGRSQAIAKVAKGQLWSSCFGGHLIHAMDFKNVLEERNLLIVGPTGAGKELASGVLLASLPGLIKGEEKLEYKAPPIIKVNLTIYPPDIVGAQLMGYKKGAYTGATKDFDGLLRRAHQGGAFLDEVGDLPLGTQVKLLRTLETKRVQPLGGEEELEASCRVVSATHVDLSKKIETGAFRRDLYYRLAGKVIELPPLAERKEDLEVLAASFLREWGVSALAIDLIRDWSSTEKVQNYQWPGNIREFRKAVSSVVLGEGWSPQNTRETTQSHPTTRYHTPKPENSIKGPQRLSLDKMIQRYAREVLEENNSNISKAARILEVSRARLRRLISHSEPAREKNSSETKEQQR